MGTGGYSSLTIKICNYGNLRNIDIGLAETVAIIGENNSGDLGL